MKKSILLSLVVISISSHQAYGQDENLNCVSENTLEQFGSEITNLANLKVCPTEDELLLKKVTAEYIQFYGGLPQVNQMVKGFSLKGSEKELKIANAMLGAKPPKDWAVSAKGCATIQCAFEKLFKSKEAAMQVFNFKAKSGYNLSLDQTINQNKTDQHWSALEVRELDAAVSKLPKELRSLPLVSDIDRQGDGLRGHGHGSNVAAYASPGIGKVNPADLVIYDAGLTGATTGKSAYDNTSWPQEVIIHELCHHHDYKGYYATNYGAMTSEQKSSAFKALSGWREVTAKDGSSSWVHSKAGAFVSGYAQSAPAEDYAESCMNFILHPDVLEKKAPAKYAYMKKNVFNGADFKNKVWAKEQKLNWPKLNGLIADEAGCDATLVECMKEMKFESGSFTYPQSKSGNTTYYSFGTAQSHIKNSACFKNFKTARAKQHEEVLVNEPDFCEQGAQRVIKNASNKICANSEASMAASLEKAAKVDLKPAIDACEGAKDFSTACIISKVPEVLNVPEEYAPSVKSIIHSKIPNRMSAMGNKLGSIKTSSWLKACMGAVSKVDVFTVTTSTGGGPEKMLSYESSKEEYSSGYLGRYVYEDSKSKDVNQSCGNEMLQSFKENGFTIPESGNPVNLIKKPFIDELQSFESEVMLNVDAATSKCLMKKCKVTKVTELISEWEKKSPEQRSGMIDEDFIGSLLTKMKSY
jgi:hypothetical protein